MRGSESMTIKEIAKLANVSASTVSKIVNGKDENIHPETRNRVLKIVKEYNYAPYSFVRNSTNARSFLLGILLNDVSRSYSIIKGILDFAHKNGYNIILQDSRGSNDAELKNITALCKNKVDGVIWEKVNEISGEYADYFVKEEIPVCTLNDFSDEVNLENTLPYEEYGHRATQKLVDYQHSGLGCVIEKDNVFSELFFRGYQKCLYENNLPFHDSMRIIYQEENIFDEVLLRNLTGAVCANMQTAMWIQEQAGIKKIRIPEEFSVISLKDDLSPESSIGQISSLEIPFYEFGRYLCQKIIQAVEKTIDEPISFSGETMLSNENSIDIPITLKKKKIVVVGSIHADVTVNVEDLPQSGKTVSAQHFSLTPGGKGANQAIGAAKMGADTILIGRIGNDYDGNMIYNSMLENHVEIQGIARDKQLATGKAYIHVQKDGESSIVIYAGANQNLKPKDIEKNARLFENTGFCLLQTEIPMETVECAASIGKQKGAAIILKPSATKQLSDSLLSMVDFFIPNYKEAEVLCPQEKTLEEKADYFLAKGVKTVIITLGHRGCFLRNKEYSQYFPAAQFPSVDTTGGADAFIATLAAYLLDNHDLHTAIRFASYAAGFVINRQGVVPALIDRNTLEMYATQQE